MMQSNLQCRSIEYTAARSSRRYTGLLLAALLILVAGCVSPPSVDDDGLLYSDQPLVDMIYQVDTATFIDQQSLIKRITDADYLLLGELHDNQAHHRHQAWVISELAKAGRDAGNANEMN